jgi:hypothetical protein
MRQRVSVQIRRQVLLQVGMESEEGSTADGVAFVGKTPEGIEK